MKGSVQPQSANAEAGRLRVELGPRSYEILVAEGLIAEAGALIAPLVVRPRVVVVTDETVARLHLPALKAGLVKARLEHLEIVLPPGERTKDFVHFERLIDDLLDAGIERGDTVVAFGGGVVGDLTGFAASVLRRGVAYVQVPTTLLAQADSAVGGKTGINTRHGKNLVGTFHQPRLVLADVGVLATLPRRELRAGYAEVVKYGLIGDAPFFAWLEENGKAVCDGEAPALRHAVLASCTAKARVVAADEREAGRRALLNLGHTFAHALEAATGYDGDRLLHGEAVAIGLVLAFELSVRLDLCAAEEAWRVRRHLEAVGLPTSPKAIPGAGWEVHAILDHMAEDKKVQEDRVAFVLTRGIGQAFLSRDVPPEEVLRLLEACLAG
ncbi:MAG: 3-dehydroquinate synthase [Alphaproteobacteria bacterium]